MTKLKPKAETKRANPSRYVLTARSIMKRALDTLATDTNPARTISAAVAQLRAVEPDDMGASLAKLLSEVCAVSPSSFRKAVAALDSCNKETVCELLQSLLQDEYLQRDVYEQYSYLLFGPSGIPVQEHLKEHLEEEMAHIETLQRYLVSFGEVPSVERKPIPVVPATLKDIMELDQRLEKAAVERYSEAIKMLEGCPAEFIPLRVDLEDIVSQEQEHLMDLDRWLKSNGQ